MRSIISELIRTDKVVVVDKIQLDEIKTKSMSSLLKSYKLESALIVINDIDEKIFLSSRNLKNIGIATVDYLDPPLMLSFKNVLFTKDSLLNFEKRFGV
jgi:large subunit ribosomal protein L4